VPNAVARRIVMDVADRHPEGFFAGVVTALARQHGGLTKLFSNQLHMLKSGGYLDSPIDPATGRMSYRRTDKPWRPEWLNVDLPAIDTPRTVEADS
jgi:hypothetical protein